MIHRSLSVQVGVAVYLAHVGSFVPAEKAIIGLTDRIFTRIATVETSALPQSSFTIDVNQASSGGAVATRKSRSWETSFALSNRRATHSSLAIGAQDIESSSP